MKQKNLNWMQNLVRWLFSILNSGSPTNLRQRIFSFIILASVTFAAYLVFDWMGLHDYFCYILGKVEYRVILQGIRVVVFKIFGPFAIPFCSVLGYSICFMDPAEGQPAAGGGQPAAGGGQPANAPAQPPAQDETNQPAAGGGQPANNAPAQAPGAVDLENLNYEQHLANHREVANLIQAIHRELHTRVPGGFQAERLTEMLEERHGAERMHAILQSLQLERNRSAYFSEVQTYFRTLRDSGGTEMQLRKEWQGRA